MTTELATTELAPTDQAVDGRVHVAEDVWLARAREHRLRVERWTVPHRARQQRGEAHPVLDFLFSYYSWRPAQLERWHPGHDVVVLGDAARELLASRGHVWDEHAGGATLERGALPARLPATATFVRRLLLATAARRPRLGCFGLHEWAMVYRSDEPRHGEVPLRLGAAGTDAVVEQMSITCTHHDAFRFFTEPARPLNLLQPSRDDQVGLEQPGCLHATMDLYKWAYKLAPVTPSALLADCFELAADVRELDMRASPYDLAAHGYEPVEIETPAGRAAYVRAQQGFAERAAPLRDRLVDVAGWILADG